MLISTEIENWLLNDPADEDIVTTTKNKNLLIVNPTNNTQTTTEDKNWPHVGTSDNIQMSTENENWPNDKPVNKNMQSTYDASHSQKNASCTTSTQEIVSNASVMSNALLSKVFEFEKSGKKSLSSKEAVATVSFEKKISPLQFQELANGTELAEFVLPVTQNLESEKVDEPDSEISFNDRDANELKLSESSISFDPLEHSPMQSCKVFYYSLENAFNQIRRSEIPQLRMGGKNTCKMEPAGDLLPFDDAQSQLRNEEDEQEENNEHDSSILELEASRTSYAEFLQQSLNSMSLLDVEEDSLILEDDVHKEECSLIAQTKSDKSAETFMKKLPVCDNLGHYDSMKLQEEKVHTKELNKCSVAVSSVLAETEHGILDTSGHNKHLFVRPNLANELCKEAIKNSTDEPEAVEMQHQNFNAANDNAPTISTPHLQSTRTESTSLEVTGQDEARRMDNAEPILKKETPKILSFDTFTTQSPEKSGELNLNPSLTTTFSEASTTEVQKTSSLSEIRPTRVLKKPIEFPQNDEVVEKKAYMEPFISSDPSENRDNEDPRWDVLRRITCDEDRVRKIRELWLNVVTPDPNVNMTRHARKIFMNACLKRDHKDDPMCAAEKIVVLQSFLLQQLETSRKRARDNSADYDVIMPPSKRQKFSAASDLSFIKEKVLLLILHQMIECEAIVHEDFDELCRTVGLGLPAYKKRRLSNDYEKKVSHIVHGLSEAERLHLFYSGVSRNEETKREWMEMEHLYQAFRKYYNWQGNEFCTINY
ncbi:hypothetical protein FHG87_008735 [Trinorchestia longiramus]|nr:hypothetical protein FHG87_008735 [Trinorchestia longiramus]